MAMRVFSHGKTTPDISTKPEQTPLSFKAVPYYMGDKQAGDLSLPEEMLANKDKFPVVDDFELVVIDGRQSPPEKSLGSDAMVWFVDHAKNQMITYWDMYYIDMHPMDMNRVPIPANGDLIEETEMGYQIIMTADDDFVYVAYGDDDQPPVYTHYARVPKDRYIAEWKAFVDWYHAHPELRHPNPSRGVAPTEPLTESPKKRKGLFSKFFKGS